MFIEHSINIHITKFYLKLKLARNRLFVWPIELELDGIDLASLGPG